MQEALCKVELPTICWGTLHYQSYTVFLNTSIHAFHWQLHETLRIMQFVYLPKITELDSFFLFLFLLKLLLKSGTSLLSSIASFCSLQFNTTMHSLGLSFVNCLWIHFFLSLPPFGQPLLELIVFSAIVRSCWRTWPLLT